MRLIKPQSRIHLVLLILSLVLVHQTTSFYLPGVSPNDYSENDNVAVYVNSLTPLLTKQQVKAVMSYDYYDSRFHFCRPKGEPQQQSESLGSVLFGDRIFSSPFELKMKNNETCKLLCVTDPIPKADASFINQCITGGYGLNLVIDGLPAAHAEKDVNTDDVFYSIGFPLGYEVEENADRTEAHLNNHFIIEVHYHELAGNKFRVVGVIVYPFSKKTKLKDDKPICDQHDLPLRLQADGNDVVVYTYDVVWKPSETVWATRWDNYLHILDPSIHWISLINSVVIVLFLTGMVAMILLRSLHKDISRYNAVEAQEDVQEDYGWKLVHGDVFRPPTHGMLLSVLVGSGAQLITMTALTLVFAILGFLSPSNRGSLGTLMVILFMLFSSMAGYVSARIYKMNGGEAWKLNVILTAVLFPGVILGSLFALNFFLIGSHSSGAVPFTTMLAVLGLFGVISLPLSLVGSYYGLKKSRIEQPVRTNQIPRQIPDQPFYLRPIPSILMGGILPFGAIFIEMYFIMNSIWFHRIYYGIGFLFLVYGVLIATCSEVAILMCYFHMCNEDYLWSWRSFFTAGACGLYVFIYSILYYFTKMNISSFVGTVLFFGYSAIISLLLAVLTGSVGYLACLIFLRKIFASIKVD